MIFFHQNTCFFAKKCFTKKQKIELLFDLKIRVFRKKIAKNIDFYIFYFYFNVINAFYNITLQRRGISILYHRPTPAHDGPEFEQHEAAVWWRSVLQCKNVGRPPVVVWAWAAAPAAPPRRTWSTGAATREGTLLGQQGTQTSTHLHSFRIC